MYFQSVEVAVVLLIKQMPNRVALVAAAAQMIDLHEMMHYQRALPVLRVKGMPVVPEEAEIFM
jgi:hypothetical protein